MHGKYAVNGTFVDLQRRFVIYILVIYYLLQYINNI